MLTVFDVRYNPLNKSIFDFVWNLWRLLLWNNLWFKWICSSGSCLLMNILFLIHWHGLVTCQPVVTLYGAPSHQTNWTLGLRCQQTFTVSTNHHCQAAFSSQPKPTERTHIRALLKEGKTVKTMRLHHHSASPEEINEALEAFSQSLYKIQDINCLSTRLKTRPPCAKQSVIYLWKTIPVYFNLVFFP